MDNSIIQYMVDFTLPSELSETFIQLIPEQRSTVNRLMSEGKIMNYALSLENSKLWAVFSVDSEAELMDLISTLPLSRYMKVKFYELTFFNASHPFIPSFSVN